jgi:hypothetical protein
MDPGGEAPAHASIIDPIDLNLVEVARFAGVVCALVYHPRRSTSR